MIKFIDLFAGIGAFSLGLERSGMQCVGQVEIDPWCSAVLAKHWPHVPRFTDIAHLHFDESAKILYDDRYGQKIQKISTGTIDVSERNVDSTNSEILRSNSTSHVAMDEGTKNKNEIKSSIQNGQPFLSRGKDGKRSSAEYIGNSDKTRVNNSDSSLPKMRTKSNDERWEDNSPSASLRLQQAFGSDVALSKMPSSLAQKQSCDSRKEATEVSAIDLICGGFP